MAAQESQRCPTVAPQGKPDPARDQGRLFPRLKIGVCPGLAELIGSGDRDADDGGGDPVRAGSLLGGYFFGVGCGVAVPLPDPWPCEPDPVAP
jgi:hypothetical protein